MKKKKIIIVLIVIFAFLALFIGGVSMIAPLAEEQIAELMETPLETLDLSSIADGTYRGEVQSIPIHVIVDVVILNHEITQVVIVKHRSGQGEAANAITEAIVTHQSADIDAIAGATYSSKAILIAVMRALENN
jgi:uncharacterized protein with FMN-binding domain